jgi:hypothetical protein
MSYENVDSIVFSVKKLSVFSQKWEAFPLEIDS